VNSPLEKRLDKLREQQTKIHEEIKKIETEKKHEFRKIQKKKEALIGAMLMEMMDKGHPITIGSKSDLLALLNGFLVRKIDRTLFGLDVETVTTPANDSSPPAKTDEPKTNSSSQDEIDLAENKDSNGKTPEKEKTGRTSSKRLPVTKKQDELADQFNL